jgi:hypothetical protein
MVKNRGGKMKGAALKAAILGVVLGAAGFGAGTLVFKLTEKPAEELPFTAAQGTPVRQEEPAAKKTQKDEHGTGKTELQEKPPAGEAQEGAKGETSEGKTPLGEQTFRWDFSKRYKYIYDFEQVIKPTADDDAQGDQGTGTLSVETKGNNTASFILSSVTLNSDPDKIVAPEVIDGVTENSRIPEGDPSANASIKLLFPLPLKPLKVGESSSFESKIPIRVNGVPVWAKGSTRVVLKEYVTIEGKSCAKFDIAIEISDLSVPEEVPTEYEFSLKGIGVNYFDIVDKCFHSGELSFSVAIAIEAKPGTPFGGARKEMEYDTLVKFTRNKEEEKEANR